MFVSLPRGVASLLSEVAAQFRVRVADPEGIMGRCPAASEIGENLHTYPFVKQNLSNFYEGTLLKLALLNTNK